MIDWKSLANSTGYKSLKAAYIRDVHEAGQRSSPMRDKQEFLRHFNWVINRAKHYAVRTDTTVEEVLDGWEEKRSYWWLNYYQECNQPKLPSGKPSNVQHMKPETYYKTSNWFPRSPKERFELIRRERRTAARNARQKAGKKPRRKIYYRRRNL